MERLGLNLESCGIFDLHWLLSTAGNVACPVGKADIAGLNFIHFTDASSRVLLWILHTNTPSVAVRGKG